MTLAGMLHDRGLGSSSATGALLVRNWWAIAIRGALAIGFGLIALARPGVAMLSLLLVFAAYALIDGVFAIVAAVRAARGNERWGPLLFEGIVDIAVGAIALSWPGITVVAFVLLVAAWSMVTGALMLSAAFRLHIEHGRWWLGLSGALSILFGILLVAAPLIGAVVLTWWIAIYALLFGIMLLVLAFKLRAHRDDRRPSTETA